MEQALATIIAAVLAAGTAGLLQAPVIANSVKQLWRTLAIIGVITAALLAGFIVFLLFQRTPQTSAPQLHISNPANAATVPAKITVEGTSNLPAGAPVWILVQFETRYYPQERTFADSDGNWKETAYIGTSNTVPGTTYDVVAVAGTSTAGKDLDEIFATYLQLRTETEKDPGLITLPSLSGMAVQRLTVRRGGAPATSSPPAASPSQTRGQAPAITFGLSPGTPAAITDSNGTQTRVTVIRITMSRSTGSEYDLSPPQQGQYVIADVAVQCVKAGPYTEGCSYSSYQFKVHMPDGRDYQPETFAKVPEFTKGTLAEGRTTRGYIVVDAPIGHGELVYNDGTGSDDASWKY